MRHIYCDANHIYVHIIVMVNISLQRHDMLTTYLQGVPQKKDTHFKISI